jgi:linoleoyl-CoA desaturase
MDVKFARSLPDGFFRTLNARVNTYFKSNQIKRTGDRRMYVKSAAMLAMYIIPLLLIYAQVVSGWWILLAFLIMGVGMSGIGLCIMHDANHGSYSTNPLVNKIFSHSLTLVGGSSFTWKIQHNLLHHTFTNVYEIDEDIDDKPFLRLSPHGKLKGHHRFQHLYALVIYSLATVSWILYKDFKQLIQYNRVGLTQKGGYNPTKESVRMIIQKTLYVVALILVPILLGAPWYIVLLGFLLMHFFAGVYITTIFQLAHVVEGPEHHHKEMHPSGTMDNTWAIHQISTTANFSTRSKFVTWMSGGLNHQIEHHLFPNICHVHYPEISQIVRKTVAEFNLPYYEHERFLQAVRSHLSVLKSFGHAKQAPAV